MNLGLLAGLAGKFGQSFMARRRADAADAEKAAERDQANQVQQTTLQRLADQLGLQQQEFGYKKTQDAATETRRVTAASTLADYAADPTPSKRAAALGSGNTPQDIQQFTPAPKVGALKPWQAAGFNTGNDATDEAAWEASDKRHADAVRPPEKDAYSVISDTGPDGQPRQRVFNTKTGHFNDETVGAKPTSGGAAGAMSGQTMMTTGRMGMTAADLQQAIPKLEAFEKDVLEGKRNITPMEQGISAASTIQPNPEAKGAMGAVNNFLGSFAAGSAGKHLSATDPEYAAYNKLAGQVALALTEILPRPNQQLLQMEKGLSAADAGWNPTSLLAAQQRRRNALKVYSDILAKQQGATKATTPSGNPFDHLIPKKGQD